MTLAVLAGLAVSLPLAVPGDLVAQGDTIRAESADTVTNETLVYRRERFVYPTDTRRNPFRNLLTLEDAGLFLGGNFVRLGDLGPGAATDERRTLTGSQASAIAGATAGVPGPYGPGLDLVVELVPLRQGLRAAGAPLGCPNCAVNDLFFLFI